MAGAGPATRVLLPRPLPTPVLAFAIRHLGCVAGVMVTASHNPPQDNGYKVYLGDGSQIVPPADAEISAAIDAVGPLGRRAARRRAGRVLGDEVVEAYLADGRRPGRPGRPARPGRRSTPRCTASAARPSRAVFERAGFPAPHVVGRAGRARPGLPDGRVPQPRGARRDGPGAGAGRARSAPTWWSPTTRTPTGARSRCPTAHGWRMLRGDEVGALLGDCLLRRGRRGRLRHLDRVVLAAGRDRRRARRRRISETLTGFKWIGRVAGPGVRLRGGARLLRRARRWCATRTASRRCCWSPSWPPRLQGRGPHAARPARRHRPRARPARDRPALGPGRRPGADRRRHGRGCAPTPPASLGGLRGRAGRRPGRRAAAACRRPTGCASGSPTRARVVVRPSGTEPKLKCYLEVVVPGRRRTSRTAWTRPGSSAAGRLDAIRGDLAAAAGL